MAGFRQGRQKMKIIESREQRLLDLTASEPANDAAFAPGQTGRRTHSQTDRGWSPYDVWLTRVSHFRNRDPLSRKD
jgi:hypothetical protein